MLQISDEKKQKLVEISAGLTVGMIFFLLSFSVPYQRLELLSLDARFNLRPKIEENPDIATIDIDDRALEEEGRWQDWTRDKHARLMRIVHKGGASLVGIDMYFSEESEKTVKYEDFARAASLDEVRAVVRDYDGEFADAAKRAGNIYLGAFFVLDEDSSESKPPAHTETNHSAFSQDVLNVLMRHGSCIPSADPGLKFLPRALSPRSFPIERFVDASRGVAFAQIVREADGLVRKYLTFIRYEDPNNANQAILFPSMGLAMACDYLQVPLKNLRIHLGKYIEIPDACMPDGSRKTLRVPINQKGEMIINWAGDYKETFRHLPYSAVIRVGERDSLERIKQFLSLQDPSIYTQPGKLLAKVNSSFPDIESPATYGAYLYGAYWYETLILDGRIKFSPDIFSQLFGLSPEDDPGLYENQQEVFENVRAHHLMLAVLSDQPAASLEEASEKTGLAPEALEGAYRRMKHLLEHGGPKNSDKPLFFLEPVIIEGKELSLSDLRGRVFFYGLTAEGTHDLNPMPFSPRYPMVGSIANVFNTIVTAQFITPLPVAWKLPLFVFMGLFTGYILSSRTTIRGSLFTILFLVVYLLFACWMFVSRRIWIDVVPVGIILISDVAIVWYKFNVAEAKRKFIRGAFEQYLNPKVVEQIARNPEMLELGGKEMELTAFFSDVADFTTISEKLSASQLVELLNEYLTAMTDIILEYDGMLDKYVGDAIVAVFGAPVNYADHAARACLVALDMQQKLKLMREKWKAEGKPQLHARIGINSGLMKLGNMGSRTHFDYTMMGDSVNLASRLEGVNKQYQTNIMISGFTYALCRSNILVREIDLIQVKGKAEPVGIYEVLARANEHLPDDTAKGMRHFSEGLAAYRQKSWEAAIAAFEQALAAIPNDGPSLAYLKRCQQYLAAPPPPDWNGVFLMTSK